MSNLETLTSKSPEDLLEEGDVGGVGPHSPPPTRCTPDLVQDLPLVDSTSDTSPVGSYKEATQVAISPPVRASQQPSLTLAENSDEASAPLPIQDAAWNGESSAETFANSDGTIVRIKSTSELTRPPTGVKFITTSFARPKELSSFKRSIAAVSTGNLREETTSVTTTDCAISARPLTVTGNAIQVRAPSIPSQLDLTNNKKVGIALALSESDTSGSKSLPSTPATHPNPAFSSLPASSKAATLGSSTELLSDAGLTKFRKPPPPVKSKPKPPPPPPKPKK